MSELELVGLHEDGEHVVLQGQDGQRFRLRIDEALRAAVRRDRPQLEQLRAERSGALPPREIQARIRAGLTAEEVADASGVPLGHVRRYEGPVLAEREFVAGQARATRIGHDVSAPVLGDLVTDRLATRGVREDDLEWDAFRPVGSPWTVEVRFTVGDGRRSARWTFDGGARTVRAIDDEARWLSETELPDGPIPRRHLAAVPGDEVDAALRPVLASVDGRAAEPEPEPGPAERTEALLDDLTGRRGVRQPIEVGDGDPEDEEFEGFGPQHTFDFEGSGLTPPVPAAHPPHSRPEEATDARVLEMPAQRRRGEHVAEPAAEHVAEPAAEHVAEPAEREDGPPADHPTLLDDDAPLTAPAPRDRPGRTTARGTRPPASQAASPVPTGPAEPAGAAGPARTSPTAGVVDAPDPADGEDADDDATPPPLAGRGRARRGRASVPSWDEIVFGAKQD